VTQLVGIGASAGGLDALRALVREILRGRGLSVVIVQHLSPTHRSMLVELLAREAALPVVEVIDGQRPCADTIHVTPASCHIRYEEGRLRLTRATQPGTPKPSVDDFFTSIAEHCGASAIGVILSGTGHDGQLGIRRIHANGGLTIAQDPASCRYDGMPRAAIDTGCVRHVLAPDEIGRRLADLTEPAAALPAAAAALADAPPLERIAALVRRETGFEISLYKEGTFRRRLKRRMLATACADIGSYADYMRRHPPEVTRLMREMLISVTTFFRDSEAFKALDAALQELVSRHGDGDELRVWVPGCATGEEAYSVAILLKEAMRTQKRELVVRIFATDLDAAAIVRARRGTFGSAALSGMPPEWRQRYLVAAGENWRVAKSLRDSLIFSVHNLIGDPPFLRLDLISCRNVLIYLRPALQNHLFESFYHALNPGALLFLGRSESVGQSAPLFRVRNERARLYTRMNSREALAGNGVPAARLAGVRVVPARPVRDRESLPDRLLRSLFGRLVPPSVIIDESLTIRHVFGDVTPFVRLGEGQMSADLFRLAVRPLRFDVRSLVMRAQRETQDLVSQVVHAADLPQPVRLSVLRIPDEDGQAGPLMVSFEALPAPAPAGDGGRADPSIARARSELLNKVTGLEEQLTANREHLHTVIEELETSNEELQSLNEEMQSSNEELQSSNEELETANEELQSANEELTTVNDELEGKTHELIGLNTALLNVKNSLSYPLIVVDARGRVVLLNAGANQMFRLPEDPVGESLFSLMPLLSVGDLAQDVARVVESKSLHVRQIDGERSYLLRAQPYHGPDRQFEGVLLLFVENTEERATERNLRDMTARLAAAERFARDTVDTLPEEICVIDGQGRIVSVNRRWDELLAEGRGSAQTSGVGANYLATCERAAASGDASAERFLAGLRRVMGGEQTHFAMEYPCDMPDGMHWFLGSVVAFASSGATANPGHCVITHIDITERKRAEERSALQSRALDESTTGVMIADARQPDYPLIYVNSAFERITGYARQEALGRNARFLQGEETVQAARAELRGAILESRTRTVLLRNRRKDASYFWNELTIDPIVDDDGRLSHFLGIQNDVTDRVQREQQLRGMLERERFAFEFAQLGTFELDVRDGSITCSDIMRRLFGLAPGHGLTLAGLRELILADDRLTFDDALKFCLAGHSPLNLEYRVAWPDGTLHWLHSRGDVLPSEDGVPRRVLCLTQDVTQRRETESQARFIAHHDALTGLPNRALLNDRLQLAISTARRERRRVAVVFLDLDRFKEINDSLGHQVGDALLKAVATRLTGTVRDTDTICRLSGDEFIALLPGVHDSGEVSRIVGNLHKALAQPFQVDGVELRVTASIGVALYPDDADSIDLLMRNADAAMYHAKGSGRNAYQFFSPEMNTALVDRLAVAGALRTGLRDAQLELHYQPEIDVATGRLLGIEALVRWRWPQRGLTLPDVFIPVAEDSDLIHEIGEWVLNEACRQNRKWQDAGLPRVPIAVNVSPAQFRHRKLIETVSAALHDSGLEPCDLELEITERVLTHNNDLAAEMLGLFHRMGIGLAIDDFGTGYSSMTYLHRFPIDKLKIDRSFVAAAPQDKTAAMIVRAIVGLGNGLGVSVVAEGVETAAQLDLLRSEGCGAYQGYYFSRPVASTDLAALIGATPPSRKTVRHAPH
jgi:two-component system CheB/CheR fusion protein